MESFKVGDLVVVELMAPDRLLPFIGFVIDNTPAEALVGLMLLQSEYRRYRTLVELPKHVGPWYRLNIFTFPARDTRIATLLDLMVHDVDFPSG